MVRVRRRRDTCLGARIRCQTARLGEQQVHRDTLTVAGGTAAIDTYSRAITANLGTAARAAASGGDNQQAVIDLLTARKEPVASVDLDEEATNLIEYQHAHQAAALSRRSNP